jgi:hypothetical protein
VLLGKMIIIKTKKMYEARHLENRKSAIFMDKIFPVKYSYIRKYYIKF